jgi:uncharacterized DUF497 family protein
MIEDDFEWDDAKAAANLVAHGVSFEQAVGAFLDPFGLEFQDDRAIYDEDRFVLVAMTEGRVLTVAYTIRDDTIRIISARQAEPHERRRYHETEE